MSRINDRITIREARPADAELISVLGAVTFYEAYFEQDDPPDLAEYILASFAVERIRAEIERPAATFFVAYLDDRAVGYAKLRDEERHESVRGDRAVELQRIYLVERVFGRGVGEILLRHCLDAARARGYETLWLGVWQENPRAIRFYEKHGFVRRGTLKFPYGDAVGINLVMEKAL